ncbi:MAG: hypothetical protein WC607_03225 [Candidatus Micrarchaeia archaeon]
MIRELFKDRRVQILALAIVCGVFLIFLRDWNPATVDLNFGIEFIGGVRIPISLEKPVDAATMSQMVDIIKTRVNKFGLKQAIVRPLGNTEIIVEIPRADSSVIQSVESILREQGRFEAVIDGVQALSGDAIISSAVGGAQAEFVNQVEDGGYQWELYFAITGEGQEHFAEVASGKYGYAVLMFLDRPENAAVIGSRAAILGDSGVMGESLLNDALRKQGDDILLVYSDEFESQREAVANRSLVVLPEGFRESEPELVAALGEMGFTETLGEGETGKRLAFTPDEEFTAEFFSGGALAQPVLSSWKAIGLMSAPTLRVEPVKQKSITQYTISGSVPAGDNAEQQAVNEVRMLKSVLSGGRLPVSTIVGSYYDVAPQLGEQFLLYSVIGTFVAILAVSLLIIARYRKLKLIVPIVFVNSMEILLTLAVIGSFGTLDLAAMAGVITLIGTGINDQLIITDEMLKNRGKLKDASEKQREADATERVKKAFYIVFTAAGIAIASMLPLLLSGIVEITGFALSAIIGVIIGVTLTRPVYGLIMEKLYGYSAED